MKRKIVPVINLTGTNVRSTVPPNFGQSPHLSSLKQKTLLFHFYPLATSFDTFVDFSAPPLSVKCGIQNTSNRFIFSRSPGNSKKSQKRLFKLDTKFLQFLDRNWADSFRANNSFLSSLRSPQQSEYLHHRMFAHDQVCHTFKLEANSSTEEAACFTSFATAFVAFSTFLGASFTAAVTVATAFFKRCLF